MRLVPRNLIGQVAVLLGAALLVAQLINFTLILNERQKVSLAQNEGPAITRFISIAADLEQTVPEFRSAVIEDSSRRGAQFAIEPQSKVSETGPRAKSIEDRLRLGLAEARVPAGDVRAAFALEPGRRNQGSNGRTRVLELSMKRSDGSWLNGRLPTPQPDPWLVTRLAGATLLLYLIVLGASLLIARRLVGPLGELTRAAERFHGRGTPEIVVARGPADLQRAIDAFNAMNRRIVTLLAEKDVMLGAIGHDLRTPLASLRIRVESVEPEDERLRLVATIEQMAAMLEDILVLARTGRAQEAVQMVDLAALTDSLVEEYRGLGRPVEMQPSARLVAPVRVNSMRRAIRNLIDNAVAYGGSAEIRVEPRDGQAAIAVSDQGPGLPPDLLQAILEPFSRMEVSRNRETGGSGLGLAIALAVAEGHGGSLRLSNRSAGGLTVILSVPVADARIAHRQ